jgi:hypothetical protein
MPHDRHLAAEDAARLALEIRTVGGPVDEIRTDKRRRQDDDNQAADDDEKPGQYPSPV